MQPHQNAGAVYALIASEFSRTRYSHWNKVKLFIQSLNKYSTLLDVGCGNGKYTSVRNDLTYIGCDITKELLSHAQHLSKTSTFTFTSHPDFFQVSCECERLPIRNETADAVICIAVLHHITSYAARVQAVRNLLKAMRAHDGQGQGEAMVTVWAYEQLNTKKRDTKWKRLHPEETDYLVPWHSQTEDKKIHWRFYHLFTYDECVRLCEDVTSATSPGTLMMTYSIEYELDNWVMTYKPSQKSMSASQFSCAKSPE